VTRRRWSRRNGCRSGRPSGRREDQPVSWRFCPGERCTASAVSRPGVRGRRICEGPPPGQRTSSSDGAAGATVFAGDAATGIAAKSSTGVSRVRSGVISPASLAKPANIGRRRQAGRSRPRRTARTFRCPAGDRRSSEGSANRFGREHQRKLTIKPPGRFGDLRNDDVPGASGKTGTPVEITL
jgi:hypothetical protein